MPLVRQSESESSTERGRMPGRVSDHQTTSRTLLSPCPPASTKHSAWRLTTPELWLASTSWTSSTNPSRRHSTRLSHGTTGRVERTLSLTEHRPQNRCRVPLTPAPAVRRKLANTMHSALSTSATRWAHEDTKARRSIRQTLRAFVSLYEILAPHFRRHMARRQNGNQFIDTIPGQR